MPDQRIRELERRWRETGDAADGAAWVQALLRAGEVRRERVELAARLGDEASAAACGVTPVQDASAWLGLLIQEDAEVALRGALAAAWLVVPVWEEALAGNKRAPRARHALEAAERWWLAPSAAGRRAARTCAARLTTRGTQEWLDGNPRLRSAATTIRAALRPVVEPEEEPGELVAPDWSVAEALRGAASVRSWTSAIGSVRQELVPWLLERGDPLRERVEAERARRADLAGALRGATGPGAAAAWIQARLEAGEVERAAVRLGAYAGSAAAEQALRAVGEMPAPVPDDFETWVLRSMAYGGLTAPVAMFLAIGRRLVGEDDALEVTAAWVADPSPERAADCLAAAHASAGVPCRVAAAVAAVGLEEHRERRSALRHLLADLQTHAVAAGLDESDLRAAIRDALAGGLL